MTAVRTVQLSCDRDNCTTTYTITFDTEVQQHTVREEAHRAGWTRTSTKDFCPEHRSQRPATRYAVCPREGCGRTVPVREDGSLRRHRMVVGRGGSGLVLGKTCVDPVTGEVHTRYPDLVVEEALGITDTPAKRFGLLDEESTMSTLHSPDSIKSLRETICVAQTHLAALPDGAHHVQVLQRLADDCDRQRPLGPDGAHGDRHTETCGCEDPELKRLRGEA